MVVAREPHVLRDGSLRDVESPGWLLPGASPCLVTNRRICSFSEIVVLHTYQFAHV